MYMKLVSAHLNAYQRFSSDFDVMYYTAADLMIVRFAPQQV